MQLSYGLLGRRFLQRQQYRPELTLVERWNGNARSIQNTPHPDQSQRGALGCVMHIRDHVHSRRLGKQRHSDARGGMERNELVDRKRTEPRPGQLLPWRVVHVRERLHRFGSFSPNPGPRCCFPCRQLRRAVGRH